MLRDLLTNYPLWTAAIAILSAQVIKLPWHYFMNREWDWNWLVNPGGMPSSHTSAVTSLATAVGLQEGMDSPIFALSAVFAVIVMYDATGVRRQAGMHAQVLNQLRNDFASLMDELRQMKEKSPDETRVNLKEILGHQPIEVFTGAWFGFAVALLVSFFWH
ncbi:divergent PAP2 family protein [Mechercharimyces sp. CAU 1602]|uniref:divergent PAP2 family protein n=1 Tax=Mechercharimyces sp. CAU 1602 TaxID=2973933 RepID=UPI0021618B75|nr:divergent PAP2 family protein [Mechercharimyces sp. CAU 1602]MCS1351752.1 divergent PAP2 family protein [Mechercharimyces sp. CAU 1602]